MTWAEGLALAAQDFSASWEVSNALAIPTTGTLATLTRAEARGAPEEVLEYPVAKALDTTMSGQDALLLILIADGESAAQTFVSKLISADYTVMGATIFVDTDSPLSPPDVLADILIDKSFTNA